MTEIGPRVPRLVGTRRGSSDVSDVSQEDSPHAILLLRRRRRFSYVTQMSERREKLRHACKCKIASPVLVMARRTRVIPSDISLPFPAYAPPSSFTRAEAVAAPNWNGANTAFQCRACRSVHPGTQTRDGNHEAVKAKWSKGKLGQLATRVVANLQKLSEPFKDKARPRTRPIASSLGKLRRQLLT